MEKISTEKLGQVEAGMGKSRKDKAGKGTKTGWENVKMWGKQNNRGRKRSGQTKQTGGENAGL